jgi:hypothetical protein
MSFDEECQDWPTLNRERGLLIDKLIACKITDAERERLEVLNEIADEHVAKIPRPQPPQLMLHEPEPPEVIGSTNTDSQSANDLYQCPKCKTVSLQ